MANLSQQRREKMLKFLETLKEQHKDDASLIAINQIEKELTSKKYGLVWEEHEEEVDVKMQTHIPVFTEVEDKEIVGNPDSDEYNFLLEGDNLHSLKLLEKTHKGKIDVIYIDPPYNTGNKFTYNDENVELADTFRHSKWLSFIQERLRIAKKLLSDNGIIFISIDDNEQANLKLLCDEIFGENNFFTQIIVQSNRRGQTYKQIAKTHEYILVYTKSQDAEFNEIEKTEEDSDLNLIDDIGRFNIREIRNRNPKFGRFNRPNLFYPFYVNPDIVDKDGFSPVSLEQSEFYTTPIYPYNSKGEESCWRWGTRLSTENINSDTLKSNVVAKKKKDGCYNIYEKYRKSTYKAKSIWDEVAMITEKGTVELGEMGLAERFDFPKPVELICKCLKIGTRKDSIVLDFFAGSGTTGQAVMDLNKQDGGYRKFILCTNNENNICENVTYQRIRTVITGKRVDGAEYSEGRKANLKYYKTDFVDKESEEIYDDLLEHTKEMIQLQYGVKVDNQKYIMIMDDEEMDEFETHFNEYEHIEAVFINQDVLMTTSQEKMLQDINTKIIPDCYFDFELREVGELW